MKTLKAKLFSSLDESKALKLIEKSFNNPEKVLALCLLEDLSTNDLDTIVENNNRFEIGNREWLIVNDEEGDDIWDEYLESYIDDCILCEIPERYRMYFDNEKFKRDCQIDGRAHSLASYDGNEDVMTVNNTEYFIYRTN